MRYVFELHRAFDGIDGKRHMTGGRTGTLYSTLELAQQEIPGVGWSRRNRSVAWESDHQDLVVRRPVIGPKEGRHA